jgi:ribonuclease HII
MVIGIDEVGRGCWAGPLVAGAVCFNDYVPSGLKDSKLLSRNQRARLDKIIRECSQHIGLGWVMPEEIDQLGLTDSVRLAMLRAVEKLPAKESDIIIDGNYNFLSEYVNAKTLIKADQTVPEVSAASIIAKVARDNFMIKQATNYPGYHFESHVGYGTKTHSLALAQFGICSLHRKSYKPILKLTV